MTIAVPASALQLAPVSAHSPAMRPITAQQTRLDTGHLPLLELAQLGRREAQRPRPVYTAHRWFARRFGTAMRALLVASVTRPDDDFWAAFDGAADLTGTSVADLFVGGGTILYEAHRLGATTYGADIDPVACAVTQFELGADSRPDPLDILDQVLKAGEDQRALYRTRGPKGDAREAVHIFWVQQITCGSCEDTFDAHPDHLIARNGDNGDWVFCASCGDVTVTTADSAELKCRCGQTTDLRGGPLSRGTVTCPTCSHRESLINYARRTGEQPRFRMFAIESITADPGRPKMVRMKDRVIHAATPADQEIYDAASSALHPMRGSLPNRTIPRTGRSDNRLTAYNYSRYTDLFNDRQQLHLARLLRIIADLPSDHHHAYALAMSNHLLASNKLCRYTATYRQVTPLFTLRAFVHTARPVELNPWLTSVGRGTYPNSVRKIAKAIAYAKSPTEYTPTGFAPVPNRQPGVAFDVRNTDSAHLPHIPDATMDLVVTDPPYLDNIDYSELADFFVPWLAATNLVTDAGAPPTASLAAKGRSETDASTFADGLARCFAEGARILRPEGRFVFTFQHRSDRAWDALGTAIRRAGLHVVTVFPMNGDSQTSLHRHAGSSTWDAVFVLRHSTSGNQVRTHSDTSAYVDRWVQALQLSDADRANFERAVRTAAACGFDTTDPLVLG